MLEKGSRSTTRRTPFQLLKWVLFTVVFLFSAVPFLPHTAFAQGLTNATNNIVETGQAAGLNTSSDLPAIIGRIIYIGLSLLGIVLLGIILYAGYLWMTAGGDAKKVQEAKDRMRNAIIGLIIIVSAFAITKFIMDQITGAITGGGDGSGGNGQSGLVGSFPSRAGSLGAGIIRDHYPLPNARNVARNTSIFITFKEPMKIASFITGYNDHGTPADVSDDGDSRLLTGINSDNIKIYATTQGKDHALRSDQVRVRFTADHQTLVFQPVDYLGNPQTETDYTVDLVGGGGGIEVADGQAAFTGSFSAGYTWHFQVSKNLDLTPPRILNVMPSTNQPYAPNVVVQVTFSEAMNPLSITGTTFEISAHKDQGPDTRVDGKYTSSNNYQTIEFISSVSCGINSCGRQIYCLPADAAITGLIHAATLSTNPPQAAIVSTLYDGLVDAAGNSLDGNGRDGAQGPPTDNYTMSFSTKSSPDLTPPMIRAYTPGPDASFVPVDDVPKATFHDGLESSTIISDNIKLVTNEPNIDTFWYLPRLVNLGQADIPAELPQPVLEGQVNVSHRVYAVADKTFTPEYYPELFSGIQNLYQNCFNPATYQSATDPADACQGAPHCCNGVPSQMVCAYPVPAPTQ